MSPAQDKFFNKLVHTQRNLTHQGLEYWNQYSHLGTWQFWTVACSSRGKSGRLRKRRYDYWIRFRIYSVLVFKKAW
ncbi:hypothetical protein ABE29_20945 [Cytobacillus firmus]|nr:hypothetical protein [Cytobacillus firmus]MBG9547833.1 hypothetical protein [Cytobacillus firmus]MBG9554107.1 hypothetical protein [Cytobacillus firmus]MBG9559470.1 hypothetical protein [Cytobacillus firmus]MBG9576306.1 hypothetical protein [Cytobacillus firmus]